MRTKSKVPRSISSRYKELARLGKGKPAPREHESACHKSARLHLLRGCSTTWQCVKRVGLREIETQADTIYFFSSSIAPTVHDGAQTHECGWSFSAILVSAKQRDTTSCRWKSSATRPISEYEVKIKPSTRWGG